MTSTRNRSQHPLLLLGIVLATVTACSGSDARPSGRYQARDATGGLITLDFRSESEVGMAFGDDDHEKLFGRVCSYTIDGDDITISDASVEKSMELEVDGDTLVWNDLVFAKQ